MRRTIPSLSALIALESAGRLSSFSRAADELGVTQGAISRQIRALEIDVAAPLFERSSFGVALTPVGASYIEAVRACLAELEAATDMVRGRKQEKVLRIAVPPTFAARWLVPKLASFTSVCPGTSVDLSVRADPLTAADRSLDGEIIFAEADPNRPSVQRLTHSYLLAVCAPTLATTGLAQGGLIELGQYRDWAAFRLAHTQLRVASVSPQAYDYFDAGIQAAILGRGVLLAPPFLVLNELKSGALVAPLAIHIERSTGYFFRLHSRRHDAQVAALVEWARAELDRSQNEARALLGRRTDARPASRRLGARPRRG